ncbi:MAG: bifunctional DNA primase/polymerase [Candidatus Thermoplasmatota archaeon]|nr:bifunctional DNA primase/polymerase [Candidatus Thermoplasmatota archaeon]
MTLEIPEIYKNPKYRFIKCKTGKKRKEPLENDWTLGADYKYTDNEFIEYCKSPKSESYGFKCGYNDVVVVDCDRDEFAKDMLFKIPKTLTIQTGSKKIHIYLTCKGYKNKVLTDKDKIHHGEIQALGKFVVGIGSKHPNGGLYEILHNEPIAEITPKELDEFIKPYIKEEKELTSSGLNWDIENVAKTIEGLKENPDGSLQGVHPVHGSTTGKNFRIDFDKDANGVWHCFRDGTGGDAVTLIGIIEGIVDCSECTKDLFKRSPEKFQQILAIAGKYGYEIDNQKESTPKEETITPEKEKKSQEILKDPKLLLNILKEIEKNIVGDEDKILVLVNKIHLRLVKNVYPTSSNILVSDKTGGGKDCLVKNVGNVILEKGVNFIHRTGISDKSLNYWITEGDTWDGKVLYLEDPTREFLQCDALRTMASGENETTTLDDKRKLQHIKINGKPVIIVTSLQSAIDEEGIRRWDFIRVDTSDAVTKHVKKLVSKKNLGLEETPNDDFKNALKLLQRKEVIIPYTEILEDMLPNSLLERTHFAKLSDYIKSSAVLHQQQRKTDEKGRIVADFFDYWFGMFTFINTNGKSKQALNIFEEKILDILRDTNTDSPIKPSTIRDKSNMGRDKCDKLLEGLVNKGLISTTQKADPTCNFKEVTQYYVSDLTIVSNINWLSPDELMDKCYDVHCGRCGEYPQSKQQIASLFDPQCKNDDLTDIKDSLCGFIVELCDYINNKHQILGLKPLSICDLQQSQQRTPKNDDSLEEEAEKSHCGSPNEAIEKHVAVTTRKAESNPICQEILFYVTANQPVDEKILKKQFPNSSIEGMLKEGILEKTPYGVINKESKR